MHIRQMFLMFLLCIVFPATASAQSIHVLGINSIEGDDDLARNLTSALRTSLSEQGCHVDPRDISLMQMTLAFADTGLCSQITVDCLDHVAQHLSTGSLVFGIMHRVFTDVGQEVEVELHYYDRLERRIISRYTARLSLTASQEALEAIADTAAPELIRCVRTESPEVAVDEDEIDPVPPRSAPVVSDDFSELTQPPSHSSSSSNNEWVGWSLISLGAALVLVDIPAWVRINDINNDPSYRDYRYRLGFGSGGDACSNASDGNILPVHGLSVPDAMEQVGHVRSLCSEGATLEALQYVFLSLGFASAGTGSALLLSGVLVMPSVSVDRATLTISGSF